MIEYILYHNQVRYLFLAIRQMYSQIQANKYSFAHYLQFDIFLLI